MHTLSIKKSDNKETIKLDGFELKNVTGYEIKSSTNEITELTVKMVVDVNDINIQHKSNVQMVAEQIAESVQKVLRKPSEL